jgi:hypothetical protein
LDKFPFLGLWVLLKRQLQRVRGIDCHSSLDEGSNAMAALVESSPVEIARFAVLTPLVESPFYATATRSVHVRRGKTPCGKAVNLLLSARLIFAKFSLAPNAAFRQNPARVSFAVASERKQP